MRKKRWGRLGLALLALWLALPGLSRGQDKSPEAYWDQGTKYLKQRQWQPAIDAFSRALALDPRHLKSYLSRGAVYVLTKQYDEAIADSTRALALSPAAADAHAAYINRGLAYREQKLYDLALADFTTAVALQPDNSLAVYYQASALDLAGRHTQALAVLKRFVEMCPENPGTKSMLDNARARIRLLEEKGRKPGR